MPLRHILISDSHDADPADDELLIWVSRATPPARPGRTVVHVRDEDAAWALVQCLGPAVLHIALGDPSRLAAALVSHPPALAPAA